jgi:hypothetical protein
LAGHRASTGAAFSEKEAKTTLNDKSDRKFWRRYARNLSDFR